MRLLGGFHRVSACRGASAEVCLSQRATGSDCYHCVIRM